MALLAEQGRVVLDHVNVGLAAYTAIVGKVVEEDFGFALAPLANVARPTLLAEFTIVCFHLFAKATGNKGKSADAKRAYQLAL